MTELSEFRIHWDCPHKAQGCTGHFFQLLRLREKPLHLCRIAGNKLIQLIPRENMTKSELALAIVSQTRYGDNRSAEKISARQRDENMGKRPQPAGTTATMEIAEIDFDGAETAETGVTTNGDVPAAKAVSKRAKADAKKAPAKAATKKAPAKAAAVRAPAPTKAPAAGDDGIKHRRTLGGRGHLAADVEKILRKAEAGTLKGIEGPLTVHKVRALITNEIGENPSTGAVSAVFDRWAEKGYIKVEDKPMAFKAYGAKWTAAKGGSLDKFLTVEKEARAKAKAADKATAAA